MAFKRIATASYSFFLSTLLISSQIYSQSIITVDVNDEVGKVNPFVLGTNFLAYQKGMWKYASEEYWNRGAGVWDSDMNQPDKQMLNLVKDAGIKIIRFPGAQQYFDWKKTVGSLSSRPDQKFGLPEFLRFCQQSNAIPLITIPEFYGDSKDASDLVEYLNKPDTGFFWSKLRWKDGQPSAWNVKWFEFGNETYFGDGKGNVISPQNYAKKYLDYQTAMKKIDSAVQLGAVALNINSYNLEWLESILKIIGDKVDFLIVHCYTPSFFIENDTTKAENLFYTALSSDAQLQEYINEINTVILKNTGRKIPLAITEYNGLFVQDKPIPYRHTLGNALLNAEMLRIFMNPNTNIIFANSWQFANEYWGAVKGYSYKGEKIVKRPLYYVSQMYHQFFGNTLIHSTVQSETYDCKGGFGIFPSHNDGQKNDAILDTIISKVRWTMYENDSGFYHYIDGDSLKIEFLGKDVNYYHSELKFKAEPLEGYKATAWIKTDSISSWPGVCIGLLDSRGWEITNSGMSSKSVSGTSNWEKVDVEYIALSDVDSITLSVRRYSGMGVIKGNASIRDVVLQKAKPKYFPAVKYLSVIASKKIDSTGTKIYLMVINKHMYEAIAATIIIKGMKPSKATVVSLEGPKVGSHNEVNENTVSQKIFSSDILQNDLIISFKPHSLTAIEIE